MRKKINAIVSAIASEIDNAIAVASDLVKDAEVLAAAKLESQRYSSCQSCQQLMENFLIAYPTATQKGKDEFFAEIVFPSCPACFQEYAEHLDSVTCPHGVRNWENCEICSDDWAAVNQPDPESDGYLDDPSDWEKQNGLCETQPAYTLFQPLGLGLGAAEESVYYVDPSDLVCECGRIYPALSREVNAVSINGITQGCTACKKARFELELAEAHRCPENFARYIATRRCQRVVCMDVAFRYRRLFGGSVFRVQTDVDTAELVLENADGQVIGKVSEFDKYPKDPDIDFSSMPF